NLTLANGKAIGGAGGSGYLGGGGGAGLGGDLFVAAGASVVLRNVNLLNGQATGGAGGQHTSNIQGEGGGGGLGGPGGAGLVGGDDGVNGGGGGMGIAATGGEGFSNVPTINFYYPGHQNYDDGAAGIVTGAPAGGTTTTNAVGAGL